MRCNLCTRHFYPRSPCGERPRLKLSGFCLCIISIHALLAESDGDGFVYCDTDSVFLSTLSLRRATTSNVVIRESTYISIHALLAESDRGWCFISAFPQTFLSTLSLRRATISWPVCTSFSGNFYPRSPCGERRHSHRNHAHSCYFYPRSPCGERRKINGCVSLYSTFLSTLSLRRATSSCTSRERATLFLSTLSLRRATGGYKALGFDTLISIHALLAESDGWPSRPSCGPCGYFYPRSPCGERQEHTLACPAGCLFLSTLSLRRATATFNIDAFALYISIHALLAESDIGRA